MNWYTKLEIWWFRRQLKRTLRKSLRRKHNIRG